MKCPNCGVSDAGEDPHVFNNLGGKQRYRECNTRRYECTNCGQRFLSVERYLREIVQRQDDESEEIPTLPTYDAD